MKTPKLIFLEGNKNSILFDIADVQSIEQSQSFINVRFKTGENEQYGYVSCTTYKDEEEAKGAYNVMKQQIKTQLRIK